MLRHINGYSHVINPTGSDFDSQVERLTLLNVYGGALAADVTAPVLSNPTGVSTGTTTATGTVDTDEGNGTLYYYASVNASEVEGTITASGSNQAVIATGTQNVSVAGLTGGTNYYLHYIHIDAALNSSNVVSSTVFTTTVVAFPPSGNIRSISAGSRERGLNAGSRERTLSAGSRNRNLSSSR